MLILKPRWVATIGLLTSVGIVLLYQRPLDASISIDTKVIDQPVNNYVSGSVVIWPRHGMGLMQTENKVLKQPVALYQMAIDKGRELNVPMLRFGTGESYNWRDGVGPDRPHRLNGPDGTWISTNDAGIDEIISYCRAVKAEPCVLLPYRAARTFSDNSAPIGNQLAANLVEYCNIKSPGLSYGQQQGWKPVVWTGTDPNKSETKVAGSYLSTEKAPAGYFAWLREYLGHPEAYGVKYFEVGNEIYFYNRPPVSKPWATPTAYAAGFLKFVSSVKAIDPSVQLGIVGWTHNLLADDPAMWSEGYKWSVGVMGVPTGYSEAYNKADFIVLHEYSGLLNANPADPVTEYAQNFDVVTDTENRIEKFKTLYKKPIFITEYNMQYGVFGGKSEWMSHQHRLKSGLAIAKMQNAFRRQGITAALLYYLFHLNFWGQDDCFRIAFDDTEKPSNRRRTGVTPAFLALKLYSSYGRGDLLKQTGTEDGLDIIAVRDTSSGRIRVFAVNQSSSFSKNVAIQLNDFVPESQADVYTLNAAAGMEATNDLNPANVTIQQTHANIAGASFTYTFPAHSLTVIDLPPKAAGSSSLASVTDSLEMILRYDAGSAQPGQVVTYTITCRNKSLGALASAEAAFDVPSGADYVAGSAVPSASYSPNSRRVLWSLGPMQSGESKVLKCSVKVK
ncbi:MAG: alpha-L-arabinofuranosidase C-terminal domain-containing protein [Armatimonadota bacterium]